MSLPDVGFRPDTPTALTIIDCAVWPYTVAFAVEMIARHRPEPNTEEHAQWKYDGIVLMMRRCISSAINNCKANNLEPTSELVGPMATSMFIQCCKSFDVNYLIGDPDDLPF